MAPRGGEHRDAGAAVRRQSGFCLEIADRLLRFGPDYTIGLAVEIIAAPHQEGLQFAPVRAGQAGIVRGPGRDEAMASAQPVGQKRDGERVGLAAL